MMKTRRGLPGPHQWELLAEAHAAPAGNPRAPSPRPKRPVARAAEWDALIQADIEKKSAAELAKCVVALVNRFPELRQEFQERILLGEGDAPRLIGEARKELRSVTSEIGWQNHWQHDGHTPDYSRLKHRFERLAELGHADAVVELGRELFEHGMSQVEQAHDEGETGMALAECFPVVFAAVAASSLAPAEKILYAIDACELDQWDYIGEPAATILDCAMVERRLVRGRRRAGRPTQSLVEGA